jgi:hypothetical protein
MIRGMHIVVHEVHLVPRKQTDTALATIEKHAGLHYCARDGGRALINTA